MLPIKSFNELRKNLKKDTSQFPDISVSVLGDNSTQFLVDAIKGYGFEAGLNFKIYEADYDRIDAEIFDGTSELYEQKSQYTIIINSTQKLLYKFYQTPAEEKKSFAKGFLNETKTFIDTINGNYSTKIILHNFGEINDEVFGSFANKIDFSFTYQLRKINLGLMDLCRDTKNLYINDVSLMQSRHGLVNIFDPKNYVSADIVFNFDFIPSIAKGIVDIILSLTGKAKKCLILDLDNTIWGGIIGDDGIENIQIGELGIGKAFSELQLWAKQLKERGILLAVCSKNDYDTAKSPFDDHPDMVLSFDDIAVFIANWDNKADNILRIQETLNIGLDSMVFLDDNPFERNLVREFLPDVLVPELPEDPAEYLMYLRSLNLFETSSFSEEDTIRTEQYKQENRRSEIRQSFINEDEYLGSLNMVSECKPFDKFTTPRVAQLSQRSNQFNLRTVRYSDDDIQKISESDDYLTISFTLEDKFGNYGLICLIIMQKKEDYLFIDTWIMSCRVLKRTMENFVLNTIVKTAKSNGLNKIVGEYIPTKKNGMVKDHYRGLGFSEENSQWVLYANSYEPKKTFIEKKTIDAIVN